jgi:hypothetical protein
MRFTLTISFLLLSLHFPVLGQTVLSGNVVDSKTKKPLPYVSIQLKNSNLGNITSDMGTFKVFLRTQTKSDTLVFSFLG